MSNCVESPLPDDDLVPLSSEKVKDRKASADDEKVYESYITVNRKNINKFKNQPQMPQKRENSAEYNFKEEDSPDPLAMNKKHDILTRNDTWKQQSAQMKQGLPTKQMRTPTLALKTVAGADMRVKQRRDDMTNAEPRQSFNDTVTYD